MTPEELHRAIARGDVAEQSSAARQTQSGDDVRLLDVRNRDEYEAWRISGETVDSTVVPYSRFMAAEVQGTVGELAAENGISEDENVVVVCGRGEASDYVAELLREAGYDAENLERGMRGWARVYDAREVPADAEATVLQYRRPSSGCLAYLVVSGEEAAVVDPLRAFADRYVADARERGAELRYAVDTHVHADHVSGVRDVADLTGAEIVLPTGAANRGLAYADAEEYDVRFVGGGDELRVGDATLTAVDAPGHTPEMTAFRLSDLLFAGDSLFVESVARPDLAEGDEGAPDAARRLHRTLTETFEAFEDDVTVAPGHYGEATEPAANGTYTATLGELRDRLSALSMDEAAFVEYVLGDMPPRPANYEEIVETNIGREALADEEAFELELGPNNCAATAA
ncbi:MBL fold metallo-hydrolase [Halopelagius longus]|uniref:Glyoxylase, beta-lactamase superfamily II n=1 Tax=Halopelagius longus TaxID=1236180 RepID=A0A1H1AS00_9EURY|nr:MBL fold metallo-hydrolase [Halopelagius longus]RDI70488.1 MBL fold metallo-hydrolase [Halopelagius longus]SDQ42261.1 Glyoxylase, beta-lactamase superfamily II [Halopelagius longus]